jgi:hypothetical protein
VPEAREVLEDLPPMDEDGVRLTVTLLHAGKVYGAALHLSSEELYQTRLGARDALAHGVRKLGVELIDGWVKQQ